MVSYVSFTDMNLSNINARSECPICTDPLSKEDIVAHRSLDSKGNERGYHIFHKSCLSQWMLKRKICPICNLEARMDLSIMERIKKVGRGLANKVLKITLIAATFIGVKALRTAAEEFEMPVINQFTLATIYVGSIVLGWCLIDRAMPELEV